jgi:hypothetical protein
MRDGSSLRVQGVAARQPERFQPGSADRICTALPLWEPSGDKDERVFVQVIDPCRITFQHALELAACRGQIGVEL